MSQVAVLVASHGEFAKHALKSAEMIVGEQDNCGVVIVSMDLTLADAEKELAEELNKLDRSAGTVILVDIFGGTPSNMSGRIVLSEENVLAVSGLNLPMLLDLFSNRDRSLDEIAESLKSTYQDGFTNITEQLNKGEDEDECEIL
ncbi:PTS sugar transporter subunit IIA [Oceanobacillus sp. FSL W8-0428]|uniref:PTS mannose transporter subunit IIAB n=1 Tax=Oceanobacillus sojae TaxID=582851 RepID=A0A511ZLV6_9BACI|nr:PTS sugar transporter subunit IIA [Oceanobacillus sojae]GEN88442.1 PTS mannose transporter subunit IIAB [Oceanobacillus sojae]